eukprot:767778-Hanusia_phi.AAC.4
MQLGPREEGVRCFSAGGVSRGSEGWSQPRSQAGSSLRVSSEMSLSRRSDGTGRARVRSSARSDRELSRPAAGRLAVGSGSHHPSQASTYSTRHHKCINQA